MKSTSRNKMLKPPKLLKNKKKQDTMCLLNIAQEGETSQEKKNNKGREKRKKESVLFYLKVQPNNE